MLENYALSSTGLYEIFREKGIEFLYHANSVSTSLTYIEKGSLLSRHFVEENNLKQTPQDSDTKDKHHDVWDSVFVDGTDHHKKFNRENYYGPILFKIKLSLLLHENFEKVYVTRFNPQFWPDSMPDERKYYKSLGEVKVEYLTGVYHDARIMFTFRNIEDRLKIGEYVDSIVYDDPKLKIPVNGKDKEARDYLRILLEKALLQAKLDHIPLQQRIHNYPTNCSCFHDYETMWNNDKPKFIKFFGH